MTAVDEIGLQWPLRLKPAAIEDAERMLDIVRHRLQSDPSVSIDYLDSFSPDSCPPGAMRVWKEKRNDVF